VRAAITYGEVHAIAEAVSAATRTDSCGWTHGIQASASGVSWSSCVADLAS
jgi:hypothetical protein